VAAERNILTIIYKSISDAGLGVELDNLLPMLLVWISYVWLGFCWVYMNFHIYDPYKQTPYWSSDISSRPIVLNRCNACGLAVIK